MKCTDVYLMCASRFQLYRVSLYLRPLIASIDFPLNLTPKGKGLCVHVITYGPKIGGDLHLYP